MDEEVTFNIGWLDIPRGGELDDPATAAYWELAARPLIMQQGIIDRDEEVLGTRSIMRPEVVFPTN
jgi:hypothetical protein